jgi:hypothetical protein
MIQICYYWKKEFDLQHKIINVKNKKYGFKKNNLIINTVKATAVISFSTYEIFSKTADNLQKYKHHLSVRTEIPRNLYYGKLNMGHSCLIIKNKAMSVVRMMKILKETMSPYVTRNINLSNFHSCLRYGIILWGGDGGSNKTLNCKRRPFK